MKQVRLFCRTAHTYGFHKSKTGFDKHNLRLEEIQPEDQNYISELSNNNVVYDSNGKAVNQSQFSELLNTVEQDQHDKIKQSKSNMTEDYAAELAILKKKTKLKFKKWSEASATLPEEKIFFENLLNKIGNEPIIAKDEIETLEKIDGKKSRFNNKVKAIKDIEKTNQTLNHTEKGSLSLKVISTEKVFKIPDQHKVKIKPSDWERVCLSFHKKFYSDYDVYYTAVHMDENPDNPHVHHRFSSFNNKTKQFDLPDHELNLVRRLTRKPDLFDGKKWSKLDNDEIQQFGELYQEIIFKHVNKCLNELNYNVKAVKRTKQEVKEDNHEYSNKTIRQRKFNGVNKLAIDEKELETNVSDLKIEQQEKEIIVDNLDEDIKQKETNLQKVISKIDKAKTFYEDLKKGTKDWFRDLVSFEKTANKEHLNKAVDFHNSLEEQEKELADDLKEAIDNFKPETQTTYKRKKQSKGMDRSKWNSQDEE